VARLNRRVIDRGFWNGKSVFVSGHTGFKGSWLSVWLTALGARVSGYSLAPNTSPAMFEMLKLDDTLDHRVGDIRDRKGFSAALLEARPDVVIHMAAQPIVSEGYEHPVETFDVNVMGVVYLLQACRAIARDIPVVVVSSDKCYLNDEKGVPFRTDNPLGGYDPYSASKAGTEIVTTAYRSSFFHAEGTPRIASGRAGNVIGGGDYSLNRLFPDAARAFSAAEPLRLRNVSAVRPWQHVLEPLYGYMVLAQAVMDNRSFAKPWNFGPDLAANRTVKDISALFAQSWGGGARVLLPEHRQDWHEARLLSLDCAETQNVLGWKPALSLDESVDWSVTWYRESAAGAGVQAMRDLTLSQIAAYEARQLEAAAA
jgi:CDP-glucose 4,6-dehydratase